MGKNILVINVDIRETRVALIENGIIAELHIEREAQKGTLGNIYLGKVSRVLPGMQAAFIDVGLERAAFLHVEDLIRPDDFEAYLSGQRQGHSHSHGTTHEAEDRSSMPALEEAAKPARRPEREPAITLPTALEVSESEDEEGAYEADDEPAAEAADDEPEAEAAAVEPAAEASAEEGEEEASEEASEAAEEEAREEIEEHAHAEGVSEPEADAEAKAQAGAEAEAESESEAEAEAEEGEDEDDSEPVEGASAAPSEGEEASAAPEEQGEESASAAAEAGPEGEGAVEKTAEAQGEEETSPTAPRGGRSRRGRGRNGRVRRSGRTRDRRPAQVAAAPVEEAPKEKPAPKESRGRDKRSGGGRGREGREGGREGRESGRESREGRERSQKRGHHEPPRVSKTTPIREVIREGQEIMVQISKEPIGTKGARVTSHVSLPGRYVVYLPTVDHVGISKRIGSEKERQRLREAIESMKPPQGGLIVRTVAEGLTKKQLKSDVGYLVRLWGEVVKKRETGVRAPQCLYTELDLILKTARDLFTDDIEKIVIDSREEYGRLKRFMEMFMPERVDAVELYEGDEPIFDAYGIEDEIQRALSRKVPLPSGGHLIIDQAEALTAIDVNTGRFVGKGSKDLEETILMTNLEAVDEIAYQLRFRNIGGLIILDLIDMERAQNREKVRKRLEELLSKDKAKTTFNRISELGLIEMTRKRTRESLGRIMLEPCFYCDGTGQLQSKQSVAYEILRQIRRERANLPGYVVIVNAHPAVIDLLKNDERVAVTEAERLFTRRIELVPRKEYHLEQFDLQGR
ncbi:Rne/Rng family ribonuclease [Polyangium aurulentum]|uniref:Rne/Rng family ribonuclease n=1 Tax=Polyangium aurulentum TaxID=2567896 RepID=UPI0010AE160E|nr:Rne/Rng family ribonuclease [Polyangium aurulentum]UQA62326.1 Rne/Rng family ribonuclease [Polyangium aurulentum]